MSWYKHFKDVPSLSAERLNGEALNGGCGVGWCDFIADFDRRLTVKTAGPADQNWTRTSRL
jgi:hypothetical protein